MSEFRVYGNNGLFHNVVKQSAIFNGRYALLEKGAPDLNISNLMNGLELPVRAKYPGVFCFPPYSELESTLVSGWEEFYFRILFLAKTGVTGDNLVKMPDPLTNTSLHTAGQDWSDMKDLCLEFINALEQLQNSTRTFFRMGQKTGYKISRVTRMQNDNVSGVMVTFPASVAITCVFDDIDTAAVEIPADTHTKHFH